jgi:hypothetical protein
MMITRRNTIRNKKKCADQIKKVINGKRYND